MSHLDNQAILSQQPQSSVKLLDSLRDPSHLIRQESVSSISSVSTELLMLLDHTISNSYYITHLQQQKIRDRNKETNQEEQDEQEDEQSVESFHSSSSGDFSAYLYNSLQDPSVLFEGNMIETQIENNPDHDVLSSSGVQDPPHSIIEETVIVTYTQTAQTSSPTNETNNITHSKKLFSCIFKPFHKKTKQLNHNVANQKACNNNKNNLDQKPKCCFVCFEPMKVTTRKSKLPNFRFTCGHGKELHKKCMNEWILTQRQHGQSPSCPLCRKAVRYNPLVPVQKKKKQANNNNENGGNTNMLDESVIRHIDY